MPRSSSRRGFADVTGGSSLTFKGGMTTKSVQLPFIAMSQGAYVHVKSYSHEFKHLVFGHTTPSKELAGSIRIVRSLHDLVVRVFDEKAGNGELLEGGGSMEGGAALAAAEADPLSMDIAMVVLQPDGRESDATPTKQGSKRKRTQEKESQRTKRNVMELPLERRACVVQSASLPGSPDTKSVRCLFHEPGKRIQQDGVWVHKDDVPWLVRYAAKEAHLAEGKAWEEDAASPALAGEEREARLEYSCGTSTWTCEWWSGDSPTMQVATQRVPKHKGPGKDLLDPDAFRVAKARAREEVLSTAQRMGACVRGLGPLSP
jgi:hypothetical protein